ncbi:hypothetical protein BB560_005158, partial [Smittium megazygosporum]
YTSINQNKYWESLLFKTATITAPNNTTLNSKNGPKAAENLLSFFNASEKYQNLLGKYSDQLSQKEKVEKTARLVGLQVPE